MRLTLTPMRLTLTVMRLTLTRMRLTLTPMRLTLTMRGHTNPREGSMLTNGMLSKPPFFLL